MFIYIIEQDGTEKTQQHCLFQEILLTIIPRTFFEQFYVGTIFFQPNYKKTCQIQQNSQRRYVTKFDPEGSGGKDAATGSSCKSCDFCFLIIFFQMKAGVLD